MRLPAPRIYLKSYRAQSLRDSLHIRGEVVT